MQPLDVQDVFSLNQANPALAPSAHSLEAAVQQFESLFVGMMLKSMRSASNVFAQGSYLHSNQVATHQEMLDQQLAVSLSNRGGIGLAPTLLRQLSGGIDSVDAAEPIEQAPLSMTPSIATPLAVAAPAQAQPDPVEQFVKEFAPRFEAQLRDSPLRSDVVLAQAALETGWGQHLIRTDAGKPAHNLFGIKATAPEQPQVQQRTVEFFAGAPINQLQAFRAYDSWEEGIDDYLRLITQSPRYEPAVRAAEDPAAYANALQQGGYATDPSYADKIMSVLERVSALLER